MRAPTLVALAAAIATTLIPSATARDATPRPRVTVIGDSVAASLDLVPKARTLLGRGIDLQLEARVCRRLVGTSCPFQGRRPPNALDTIASIARLGDVVVIDVGYNDDPATYAEGIETVMTSLLAGGVHTVIWSTLKADRPGYRQINGEIRKAAARWRQLRVVDWDRYSRARRAWFVADGLHVNAAGAVALARMLRPPIVAAACGGRCPPASSA
jgi:hypothetical protein